jgi:hypothetical protein
VPYRAHLEGDEQREDEEADQPASREVHACFLVHGQERVRTTAMPIKLKGSGSTERQDETAG